MSIETFTHSLSQFNQIPFPKLTKQLSRRASNGLNEKLKEAFGGGEGGRRGDGEEGSLLGVRNAELKVLPGVGVGGGEVGEVGDVDGEVEEGFGGGGDGEERGGGEGGGVLADGGGDGETAAEEVAERFHGMGGGECMEGKCRC